jgi:hypothetical protein
MLSLLLSLAPLFATAQEPATSPEARDGRMVLVARDEPSDEGLREQLSAVGGPSATRFTLVLTEAEVLPGVDRCITRASLEDADDAQLAADVRAADVLVLRGGTFMGWYDSTFHERHRTELFHALLDRVRARKTIIAHGGAAAFLGAGTTLPRSELDETPRNPRRTQTQVPRAAMRLGPGALLDSDAWPEASPLRWLHSLWRTRMEVGLYLVGDVALDYQREAREVRVLGPGSVLLCDLARARYHKRRLEGARLSVLSAGEGWSFGYERLLPRESGLQATAAAPGPLLSCALGEAPLASGAALLAALSEAPSTPSPDLPRARLEAWIDRGSERWPGERPYRTLPLGLALRLEWEADLFPPAPATAPPR